MHVSNYLFGDWLGPASRTIPTTDLYFLNACRPWLNRPSFRRSLIRREGSNSFTFGGATIVCRRDHNDVVKRLLQQKGSRLYYIIDDDLWAAEKDLALPDSYRQRLIALREGQHNELSNRAETIVVSSPVLADTYLRDGHRVETFDPYWSEPVADDQHFKVLDHGAPLEIGYLATASHASDRSFVFKVFEGLLSRNVNVRLTVVGTADIPSHLRNHSNLRVLKPFLWPRHRKRLTQLRFHFHLYPTLPTEFNKARSLNKLFEHAVSGGIGVYSETWQYADYVKEHQLGLLVKNEIEEWVDSIYEIKSKNSFLGLQNSNNPLIGITETIKNKQQEFWQSIK